MLRFIIFLLFLIGFSALAVWFADNDGDIVINWRGFRIETGVAFAVFLISVLIFASILFFETILFIKNAPAKIKNRLLERKTKKAMHSLAKGFAALAIGDGRKMKSAARESIKLLPEEPLSLILAAKSAEINGDKKSAGELFTKLLKYKPAEFMAVHGLLGISIDDKNSGEALALAEKAYKLAPNDGNIRDAVIDLYKKSGKWTEAELFIEKMEAKKPFAFIFGKKDEKLSHEKAVAEYMRAGEKIASGKQEEAMELLVMAMKNSPGFMAASLLYADLAIKNGKPGLASDAVEKAWRFNPALPLAEKYESIFNDDTTKKKIKRAEKLFKLNRIHPESHYLMARAYFAVDDMVRARNYLKTALSGMQTKSMYRLMIEIEKHSGHSGRGIITELENFMNKAPDDFSFICGECGQAHKKWDVSCSVCHAVDKMEWRQPGISQAVPNMGKVLLTG